MRCSFRVWGSLAAATSLLDAPGSAAIVLGDNGGVLNSSCMTTLSAAGAANSFDFKGEESAKSHGDNYQCPGMTSGSIAFSSMHVLFNSGWNSCHHPIHACAHSRLDLCGVVFSLVLWMMWMMPAWMVHALDDIRVVSNSLIQSFTEYHDDSCARLNALQNSRVGRGPHVRGGTKRATTGSLRQVRLSVGRTTFFFPAEVKKSA